MAATVKKPRYFKSPEQLAQLRARIADGMNSAYKTDMVEAAMLETGLTRSQVTEFISNEKGEKKNRGSRYKKKGTQKKTIYGAFLGRPYTGFNFNGCGEQLGNLTKAKAAEYRRLQGTEAGLDWLEENRHKAEEEIAAKPLTAIQKHNRAVGCFNKVQKEIEVLNTLGYKAAMICYQPTKRPTVLGSEDAVHFFVNDTSLMNLFDKAMGPGKAFSIRAKHKRKILRQKVQTIYNRLYAKAYGTSTSSPMPYTAIEAGTVQIMVEGLPDGISFQRPKHYKVHELKSIISLQHALKIADVPETTDTAVDSPPDIASHPISSPQTMNASASGSATERTEVQRTVQSDWVGGSLQSMVIGADGQVDLGCPEAVISSNIVSLDCEPIEDALKKALSRAQQAGRKRKAGEEDRSLVEKRTASSGTTEKKQKRGTDATQAQVAATNKNSTTSSGTTNGNKQKRITDPTPRQAAAQKGKSTASSRTTKGDKQKRITDLTPRQAVAQKEKATTSSNTLSTRKRRKTTSTEPRNVGDKEGDHTGRRIKQLFERVREKGRKKARDWYEGIIKQHKKGMYVIEFEDNETAKKEVYTYSDDQFLMYRRKKNLIFL